MHTRPIDIISSSERRVPSGPSITISEYHDNQEAGAYEENYDPVIPDENASALLWAVLSSYLPSDENSIQRAYVQKVEYDMALTRESSKNQPQQQFMAFALCLRDRLIERWKDTDLFFKKIDARVVNYLSLEFLLGRSLQNAVDNLNLRDNYSRALRNLGVQMEKLFEQETDAGLGNGGLGRLAACFLDSLATMNYPAVGYGLRYTYGMFYQQIKDGYQVEIPDFWLRWGHPWEIERFDIHYNVQFYGHVRETLNPTPRDENDVYCYSWEETENVMAIAYDVPIPGYNTFNTINLRLWSSKPAELQEFDFKLFNQGDYFKAVEKKQLSETITSLLYPNDNTSVGKALRLKQQYFFVCATLQDIIKKYKMSGKPITKLHKKVAIQLNDTHPSMSIAEMMRILFDVEKLTWTQAWKMTRKIFAYTNHTVLPEALEAWDVDLLAHTLPRHLQIIYKINHHFLLEVVAFYSTKPEANVDEMKRRLSIIQEGPTRKIRMAHLAIIGSHMVNGVAALHSFLLTTDLFPEFNEIYPTKFCNVTNGVTPRRWIHQANPALSNLITETLKTDTWLTDLSQLAGLREFAKDPDFQKKWRKVKQDNKKALVNYIKNDLGINIPSRGLFDVQIKRMHEYKRQFMNILSVVHRYLCLKKMTEDERIAALPQVIIFGGKAAPGYHIAKLIIKLINLVGAKINNDPDMESLLKVVFIPNYNVSLAEMLIPASDISQHISTAGMEASGTSNMKFAMNGGLILGTMDGANIEIREEIGEENMFIFGALTEEVEAKRKLVRSGQNKWSNSFKEVIDFINTGIVSLKLLVKYLRRNFGDFPEWHELLNSIDGKNDYYLIADDWEDYLKAKERIEEAFLNKDKWTEMSILSVAGTGKFSSDRSVKDYAEKIWNLKPHPRPGPMVVDASFLSTHIPRGLSAARPLDSMGSPQSISMERLSEYNAKLVESFSPSPSNYRSTGLDGW